MKNTWKRFKQGFHKYMCLLEDKGYFSLIFLLYILWELLRVGTLIVVIYFFYRFVNDYILWTLR